MQVGVAHLMNKYTPKQQIIVFWSKVNKNGSIPAHCPELGQCWEWTAFTDRNGYGRFQYNQKGTYSHRASWMIAYGNIPANTDILHKCDNPSCVRPDHLFIGTQQQNVSDMIAKGRHCHGEQRWNSKLTKVQADEIRERYANGERNKSALGREFDIHESIVRRILKGERWT